MNKYKKICANLRFICVICVLKTLLTQCAAATEKTEIKAAEVISLLQSGAHVHLTNKIIWDDLDFTAAAQPFVLSENMLQTEIQANIHFSDCIFLGKVTTNSRNGEQTVQTVFKNTSTSVLSKVEAKILYLFVSPASRLPVPAAQSQM